MNKRIASLIIVLFLVSIASPVFAVLKSYCIREVGMTTTSISSDMGEVDRALSSFAASHPGAAVDAFQIVPHSISGSYDIFILYREE